MTPRDLTPPPAFELILEAHHQLRDTVTPMVGMLQVLPQCLAEPLPPAASTIIEHVQRNLAKLAAVEREMLDWLRARRHERPPGEGDGAADV